METYYIIGKADTVADDHRRYSRERRESTHNKYDTLEEALERASKWASKSEADIVIYQAVKLVKTETPPVVVEDIK